MLAGVPAPRIRTYPRYTVVAEKFEAIVSLGMANSRLKDYFDLWVLLTTQEFDSVLLNHAIAATLTRRQTTLPTATPVGLSVTFGEDTQKTKQWQAFIQKNQLQAPTLSVVVEVLRSRLMAVVG
jgi:hypothetical protein